MPAYRALRPLYYRSDPVAIRKVKAGLHVPMLASKPKQCAAGDVVADLPTASVAWLLAKGWIEQAGADPAGEES